MLVVDDEDDVRDYAMTVFRRAAAVVRGASSAEEALAILDEWRPDVVISDLGMPGVDGFELLQRIRERFDSLPVIALTAYARPEDRQRVMRAGFDGFVKKPVEPAGLVAAVAEVMARV